MFSKEVKAHICMVIIHYFVSDKTLKWKKKKLLQILKIFFLFLYQLKGKFLFGIIYCKGLASAVFRLILL